MNLFRISNKNYLMQSLLILGEKKKQGVLPLVQEIEVTEYLYSMGFWSDFLWDTGHSDSWSEQSCFLELINFSIGVLSEELIIEEDI